MWATCPRSGSSDYHAEFYEGCYQKHANPLNNGTNISNISGCHTDFHEDTTLSDNGKVAAWQVSINAARHNRGTA
jgi:hypothetical protein